jgi:hypothetical protein
MPEKAKDYPFYECARQAEELIQNGATIYQKFSCATCGARNTIETPNVFYTSGKCGECWSMTNLLSSGCNYMVHLDLKARKQ